MTDQANRLILVVDDEEDVRRYLSLALEDAGFLVKTASDGFQAMEIVQREKVDLISLDLVMPKRSGAAFYRDLQKHPEYKSIPVLIVTGHARDDAGKADFEELTMSGPGIYLEKPVRPDNYVANVRKLLGIELESSADTPSDSLRQQLEEHLKTADSEALQRALDALKRQ